LSNLQLLWILGSTPPQKFQENTERRKTKRSRELKNQSQLPRTRKSARLKANNNLGGPYNPSYCKKKKLRKTNETICPGIHNQDLRHWRGWKHEPLTRCNGCKRWFHRICTGVKKGWSPESDLAWSCSSLGIDCNKQATDSLSAVSVQILTAANCPPSFLESLPSECDQSNRVSYSCYETNERTGLTQDLENLVISEKEDLTESKNHPPNVIADSGSGKEGSGLMFSKGDFAELKLDGNWVKVEILLEDCSLVCRLDNGEAIPAVPDKLKPLGMHDTEEKWERDRRVDTELWTRLLAALKLSLGIRKMDGNCLYRAFAKVVYDDPSRHTEVRAEIVKYLTANKSRFIKFDPNIEQEISIKSRDGARGGELEIVAFSELFNLGSRIYELTPQII